MIELLQGDYNRGWQRYEYRFKSKKGQGILHANPSCKLWNGEALLKGKKLLVVSEQGLGDTLQFMRYVSALRNEGISVSFCAQPKLHSLIKTSNEEISLITPDEANEVDVGEWIPLLSVPRYLGISPSHPIITEPYIKTKEELIMKWANILGTERNPVIGINWQGSPTTEKTWLRGRSIELESFAPITEAVKYPCSRFRKDLEANS